MPLFALLLLAAEGRPLFYWGARSPVIESRLTGGGSSEAQVVEVHAARDGSSLLVRFSFDRPVRDALYLPGGVPVSGRLRAALYVDRDDDRTTGLAGSEKDLRTGAELRLELGVVSVGADPAEKLEARAVVTAALYSLAPDGRRRRLWQRDDAANPQDVSAHGEWVEVRLPWDHVGAEGPCRLVLAVASQTWDGRLPP